MVLVAEVVEEHHMMLGKELINVFGPEVLTLFDVGAGELMKATLAQRVLCVGIVHNKAHKDMVMEVLRKLVQAVSLVNVMVGCPTKPLPMIRFEMHNPDNDDVKTATSLTSAPMTIQADTNPPAQVLTHPPTHPTQPIHLPSHTTHPTTPPRPTHPPNHPTLPGSFSDRQSNHTPDEGTVDLLAGDSQGEHAHLAGDHQGKHLHVDESRSLNRCCCKLIHRDSEGWCRRGCAQLRDNGALN